MTCENDGHLVDLDHCPGGGARSDLKTYGTEIEIACLSHVHFQRAPFRPRNGYSGHHPPELPATFCERDDSVKVNEVDFLPAEAEMGFLMETGFAKRPG